MWYLSRSRFASIIGVHRVCFTQPLCTKCLRDTENNKVFSNFLINPKMRDILAKIIECWKDDKTQDFPHDCRTVDTYAILQLFPCENSANALCATQHKMHVNIIFMTMIVGSTPCPTGPHSPIPAGHQLCNKSPKRNENVHHVTT